MVDAVYTMEELKAAGMKRYQRMLEQLRSDGMELQSHSAVMKKKDTKNWILQGHISFLCKKMTTRIVSEKEGTVKKREEGQHGESGNDS